MIRKRLLFILLAPALALQAQQHFTHVYGRTSTTLNGRWNYIIDPYECGFYNYRSIPFDELPGPAGGYFDDAKQTDKGQLLEYNFDACPRLNVPGDWNSQAEKLSLYEGSLWYRRTFVFKKPAADSRFFIHFGAVNYQADVYLNGKKLGKHIGGFTPFSYEVTGRLNEATNSLVLKVDNTRRAEAVPTLRTDWWNYGGISRDVQLVEVPSTFIADYQVQLAKGSANEIRGYVTLDGKRSGSQTVNVSIPELNQSIQTATDGQGCAPLSMSLDSLERWSPENPKLYDVVIRTGEDEIHEKIGFRTIETRGPDILLNGKSIFLRGICIHEEMPAAGRRAFSEADARMLLTRAKELHCNYVRLAHYPHNEHMARLADKMGILVWEENPVYWAIEWNNPDTFANAKQQLHDLIVRDKNRASVIIWSMANETPVNETRTEFLRKLAEHARELDPTRLISAALEVHTEKINGQSVRVISDPFADCVDIINFNQYYGWYVGMPEYIDSVRWNISQNKPVMISEFGGGALQGLHGDAETRWTEEYQEDIYRRTLPMLSKIPQFRGVSPWILFDFRSPRRILPQIQDGWNRKGLIGQNGEKKKAYFILRDFYLLKDADYSDQ